MQSGVDREESTGFFRVALGLYYLSGLMTKETLDFKQLDRDFNRFIYHTIGKGHSITSILQYMSGEKVVRWSSQALPESVWRALHRGAAGEHPFLLG
jgi:hypothetical protein